MFPLNSARLKTSKKNARENHRHRNKVIILITWNLISQTRQKDKKKHIFTVKHPADHCYRDMHVIHIWTLLSSSSLRFLSPGRDAGRVLRPESRPVEHPADSHPGGSQRPGLHGAGRQHLPRGRVQLEHGTLSLSDQIRCFYVQGTGY